MNVRRLRGVLAWIITPAGTPVLRDFVAIWFLLIQGLVRVVDGLIFTIIPTRLVDNDLYGILQLGIGVWVLATRSRRQRGGAAGRVPAALAAGLFLTLAVDLLPVNATSAAPAIGVALAMLAEVRYAAAD